MRNALPVLPGRTADGGLETVETRIGALEFFDGMPSPATIEAVYENLDLLCGVEVFMRGIFHPKGKVASQDHSRVRNPKGRSPGSSRKSR